MAGLVDSIRDTISGKKVLVMGLGTFGGGVGLSRFLAEYGAKVVVTDTASPIELADSVAKLAGLPIKLRLGEHREADFTQAEMIVVNPAVRRDSPFLKIAADNNVSLTSEMNLFFQFCPAQIVGITGSNGKSTTAAMTAAVLGAADCGRAAAGYRNVWLGGNIGKENLLCQIEQIDPNDIVVLELSSFQLYELGRIKRSPHIAVVTNIAPNHLDWHGTMREYIDAKQNILRCQTGGDFAILNRLDESLWSWAKLTTAAVRWFPADEPDSIELGIPGEHNRLNASAAIEVGRILGVDSTAAKESLKNFDGLEHRLEFVRQIDGVRYYNDSIATTPESTIAAIEAFGEKKVLILGGYDKKISFDSLAAKIAGSVEAVVVIGQVQGELLKRIERAKADRGEKRPVCIKSKTLAEAVDSARNCTAAGAIVLLSPACASYDMFRNFQDRGEQFKKLVRELAWP